MCVSFKKPEGHGPDAPGSQNRQEVPDGVRCLVPPAQRQQRGFQEALHQYHQHQPAQKLHDLSPPGSAGGELEEPAVEDTDHQHSPHGSGHGVGIFDRLGQIGGIDVRREGEEDRKSVV